MLISWSTHYKTMEENQGTSNNNHIHLIQTAQNADKLG